MAGVLFASGCGGSSDDTTDDKDTFVVGMECNYAPFNWQTSSETDTSVSLGSSPFKLPLISKTCRKEIQDR